MTPYRKMNGIGGVRSAWLRGAMMGSGRRSLTVQRDAERTPKNLSLESRLGISPTNQLAVIVRETACRFGG